MITGGKFALGSVGVVLLIIVFTALTFAFSWFGAGVAVFSPDNVRTQYADAYSRFNALQADACNVKQAQALVDASGGPTTSVGAQYQEQVSAYSTLFRSTQAAYDAAFENAFAAKHVAPGDLPRTAPTLTTDEENC